MSSVANQLLSDAVVHIDGLKAILQEILDLEQILAGAEDDADARTALEDAKRLCVYIGDIIEPLWDAASDEADREEDKDLLDSALLQWEEWQEKEGSGEG